MTSQAGFFGKLPLTGDFVTRGLPDAFRRHWDRWTSRHLAPRLRMGGGWPRGGLRFRLASGGRVAAGVAVPGADSAGRIFPLSLVLIADTLPEPVRLDDWCRGAVSHAETALAGRLSLEAFHEALLDLPVPEGDAEECAPMLLWTHAQPPEACPADDPTDILDRILGPPP